MGRGARPYALGGLGATQFRSVNASVGGQQRNISGLTKFSTTWALGVKVYPNPSVGVRIEARWTPTYIKSDAAGWWCAHDLTSDLLQAWEQFRASR